MATYSFTTITTAQALALTASDTLTVGQGTASATTILFVAGPPDTISMTVGATTVVFSAALSAATITYADGSRLYVGTPAGDAPPAFGAEANGLYGGAGADTLNAGDGVNQLQGNQGNDSLLGGGANDVLYGGQDNDTLRVGASAGGGGFNFAQGNKGDDTVIGSSSDNDILLGGQGNDLIGAAGRGPPTETRFDITVFLEPVGFTGGGNDVINGNLGDDIIFAGFQDDQVFGEDGNDQIYDFFGANRIDGGAGNDTLAANGNSTIDGGTGNDVVGVGGGAFVVRLGDGDDLLVGAFEADAVANTTVDGGAGNDSIITGNRADSINGGAGDDLLDGSGGPDLLVGGPGLDEFDFFGGESTTVLSDLDSILDWSPGDVLYFGDADTGFGPGPGSPTNYVEASAESYAAALSLANLRVSSGVVDYVAVQVGGDVYVFADARSNNGLADVAVRLVGRSLADIGPSSITDAF